MSLTKVSYSMIQGAPANVLDFGADPTGSADSTAAFNAIIAAQRPIYAPAGTYKVSSLNVVDYDGFELSGDGAFSTIIETNDTTNDLISIGAGVTLRYNPTIRNLSFTTSVTKTAGYVVAIDKVYGLIIESVYATGYFGLCDLYEAQLTTITNTSVSLMTPTTGKGISARSNGTSSNLILNNVAFDGGPGTQPYAGLYVEEYDGIFMTSSQFNRCGNGLVFNVPTTKIFDHLFCSNSSFDTCTGDGILIAGGAGKVRRLRFNNCWTGSNGNNGIYITNGATVTGLRFADGWIVSNGTNGVFIDESVTDTQFVGTMISGNSRTTTDTYSGIYIGGLTSPAVLNNFQIVGCKIGVADEFLNNQKYGIAVEPLTSPEFREFVVVGNDFTGNVSGASSFGTASFPANRMVKANVGLVTENTGYDVQLAANTSVTVTHGCVFTPAVGDISITAATAGNSATFAYVDTITSTTFKINTNAAPTAGNLGWGWKVNIQ